MLSRPSRLIPRLIPFGFRFDSANRFVSRKFQFGEFLGGQQTNARLEQFMRARLPITKFEDLPIPFAAVATDLKTGQAVVMKDKGDVPFAIRASCTIPGWYVPVPDAEGRQLVDGGLVAVIPSAVTRVLGADIVIAVDVNSAGATFISSSGSLIGVLLQSMMVIQQSVSRQHCEMSDLVITPKVGHIRWDQVRRADELMVAGYEAGLESIPKVRELIGQFDHGSDGFKNRSALIGL